MCAELVALQERLILSVRAVDQTLLFLLGSQLLRLGRLVDLHADPDRRDDEQHPWIGSQEPDGEQHQERGQYRMATRPRPLWHHVSDMGGLMDVDRAVVRAVVELVAHRLSFLNAAGFAARH